MNNPMYEAQLNQHEEQIRDIDGRLHSYDLGLRWCEEQIKKLAGEDYSPGVVIDNPIEKEYDKLKNDHNLLKEAYKSLDDRYEREKEVWSGKYDALQTTIDLKNRRITTLEQGTKNQSDVINHKKAEIYDLKLKINQLKKDADDWKEAYLRAQVDVNNFQRAYTEVKTENDRLTECLAKYAWRRVDTSEPLPFKDHELYLFVVDGCSTPVKGKYHDDSLKNISVLVDDIKGVRIKTFFFIDGCIRYWMPLPEMPDTAIK